MSSMDISTSLVDLGIEDPSFFHEWSMMSYFDDDGLTGFGDGFFESFRETRHQQQQLDHQFSNNKRSNEELTEIHLDERAVKQMRTNNNNIPQLLPTSNNYVKHCNNDQVGGIVKPKQEIIMPSNNNNSFPTHHELFYKDGLYGDYLNNNADFSEGAKRVNSNTTVVRLPQAQDHILAERRRREKLTQRFIALSALVPGLKKMDKASVLEDAIKHLKQLQEKVKALEEQAKKKSKELSMLVVKRHHELYTNNSSKCSPPRPPFEDSLPEIEARFSEKDVLIRIHCENKKGVLQKVVCEIEKLHLRVINTTSITFSSAVLDITVIARMNEYFSMTAKEFMKKFGSALNKFI